MDSANLTDVELFDADLSWAELNNSRLVGAEALRADLRGTELDGADLSGATFSGGDLSDARLVGANLTDTDLTNVRMIRTNFSRANLTGCRIYGVSAWGLRLDGTTQIDLIVTPAGEPKITVDNLEVGQFIYLLVKNENIRKVITTITSKMVLILGVFTPPARKAVLDAIREQLRRKDYLPVLFDFEGVENRDITETVSLLAHMARFIIADITDPRSIPQELERIIPDLPSVPVKPLLQADATEYGMFEHFKRYPWVLEVHRYDDIDDLVASLEQDIIAPAEEKARELIESRKT